MRYWTREGCFGTVVSVPLIGRGGNGAVTMSIADRLTSIVREHDAARASAGVAKSARVGDLAAQRASGDRLTAEISDARANAASAARLAERERHAEAARLARRLGAIIRERDAETDPERRARLDLLAGDVESARDRYIHATWQAQSVDRDWTRGGRFEIYARRYDLGFIGYDADDIMQDAAEMLTAAWAAAVESGAYVLPQGDLLPTGARTLPYTLGDGYRAIRHAYRRGLGFYGYERRGVVVERDTSPRGYHTEESFTVAELRWRGEDESAVRAALMGALETEGWVSDDVARALTDQGADVGENLLLVVRRRAALATLARRFPLSADGRMLALATLLAEGYTIGELTGKDGLNLTENTLTRWANELGQLVA